MKLLSGYFLPTSGTLEIDGQNLADVSRKTYFSQIGYLTQDPSVFDATIRDNLLSAAGRECSDEEIREALTKTRCEFVWDFPQ